MATIAITVDSGVTALQRVSHGELVYWQAPKKSGKYQEWYIIFRSPFKQHILRTDPNTGLTDPLTARATIDPNVTYNYMVSNVYDPSLVQIQEGIEGHRPYNIVPGGGIIIDS